MTEQNSVVKALASGRSVLALPVADFANSFLYVSGKRRSESTPDEAKAFVTFVYVERGVAAEWEPEYGPIQIWQECAPDAEDAKPHHIFAFHNTEPGSWSQVAVEREELPRAFIGGDYRWIFSVLKSWVRSRTNPGADAEEEFSASAPLRETTE